MPSGAPSRASAPAVEAVSVRRVLLVAPVAVRVRRSPAASPRISPTVMARAPIARSIPAAVGPPRDRTRAGWSRVARRAGGGGQRAGGCELGAGEGPVRLDHPAGPRWFPAAAAEGSRGDE